MNEIDGLGFFRGHHNFLQTLSLSSFISELYITILKQRTLDIFEHFFFIIYVTILRMKALNVMDKVKTLNKEPSL